MASELHGSERLEFSCAGRPRALLFSAFVVAVFSALPLVGPSPLTVLRLGTAMSFAAIAIGLFAYSRPRRRVLRIDLAGGQILADGRRFPLESAREVLLTGSGGQLDPSPRVHYRAELLLANGARLVFADGSGPTEVLADVTRLHRNLKLPVSVGWGIPSDARPWIEPRPRSSPELEVEELHLDLTCERLPSQRASGKAVLIGSAGVTLLMVLIFGARVNRDAPISNLSILLSVTSILILLLIAAALLTDRIRIRSNGKLTIEHFIFGARRTRQEIDRRSLRAAYLVGPDPEVARHLLLETDRGIVAVPCAGSGALELSRIFQSSTRNVP